MTVRPRTDADIGACLDLVRLVHATDGYPHHLPADLRAFLVSRDACAAWVAEHEGRVTGHVALHGRSSEPVMALASAALRQPAGRLAVIGRLLVSPHARGAGTGRALLAAASAEASRRGLWPVLDVVTDLHPAIRLYERCGWTRAGRVEVRFRNGITLGEYVYLGPGPAALSWFPSAP